MDLELESENFKICWEQLSTRSLHFRALFLAAITLQKSFSELKIGIFGFFSSGNVSHPTIMKLAKAGGKGITTVVSMSAALSKF